MPSRDRLPLPAEGLPKIFGEIGWETDSARLRSMFPAGLVEQTQYTGQGNQRMVAVSAYDVPVQPLGPALVTIGGEPLLPASFIELSTLGGREGCSRETSRTLPDCRDEYGPQLQSVYDEMERRFVTAYGRGTPGSAPSLAHGLGPDPRERSLFWSRRGFRIHLELGREELDGWRVTVGVTRDGAPL